jgi:hypothetical protein
MMRPLTFAAAFAAAIAFPAVAEDVKSPSMATDAGTMLTAQAITEQEAKAWVGRPVYSSDGKNIGEVAAILRTPDNKITELRANIGGFLGLGEHQIALPAAIFALHNDRVELNLPAAAAKELPKVAK